MRIFLLWLVTLFSVASQAATITQEEAKAKAERLLGKKMMGVQMACARANHVQESPTYYLFNAEDGQGFVITAADEGMGDVLGYSQTSSIPVGGKMPCGLEFFLNIYDQVVVSLREQGETFASQVNSTTNEDGAFLYTAEWGQDAPYNNMCPVVDGKHCVTGCVATGMAEILHFWKWPLKSEGYGWATIGSGAPFGSSLEHEYNWEAMKNTTPENLASTESWQTLSQLLYDCGLSVNMVYGTGGSGSSMSSAMKAFYSNFGYNPNTLRIYHKDCFTDEEWFSIIKNEIDAGRPVCESAQTYDEKNDAYEGHFFVVDGYDLNGMLHVNWGWDGSSNAYYSPLLMNPSTFKFNISNILLAGIIPAKNGETGTPTEYMTMKYAPEISVSGENLRSITFSVSAGGFMNINANDYRWQVTVGLFNTNNEMIADLKTGRVLTSVELSAGYYTNSMYNVACKLSGNYPDGDYALRIVFREYGTQDWLLPDTYGGKNKNAIYVKIQGNTYTVTDGSNYLTGVSTVSTTTASPQHTIYDLYGRKVNNLRKGIFVKDGKKVIY